MKNRDLILAGSLLLGFGLSAQAQQEDQIFFYGFEDNLESFNTTGEPLDSIMQLRYYRDSKGSTGNGSFDVATWVLDPVVYDTALYMFNTIEGTSFRTGDFWDCELDETGNHAMKMKELGAEGGRRWFHFKTGPNANQADDAAKTAESADYQGCLFIRNIPIEDYTSYRLVYYRRTSEPEKAKMYSGILRGYFNSEKSISMDGGNAAGTEFMIHETSGISNQWERVTVMTFYQNDSVANHHCYQAGYWWSSSWNRRAADGTELVYIEQPDKFFVRLTFSAPETDYYIDDIALYRSTIGGAEYNGDIIRLDFGYSTNMKELAEASSLKAVQLPPQYFTITGIDSAACESAAGLTHEQYIESGREYYRSDIDVLSAEYHTDGYMYIFLAELFFPEYGEYVPQDCAYYGDIRISFKNPTTDPTMALKYNGTLYPYSLDTEWVNAGKYVRDFKNEFVLPNEGVNAIPVALLPPTATSIEPTDGSFKLDPTMKSVKVRFNKPVYCDVAGGSTTALGVKAVFEKAGTDSETWVAGEFNEADSTVVFTRQNAYTTPLSGEYIIKILQARAGESDTYEEAPVKSFSLFFGLELEEPQRLAKDDFQTLDVGARNPAGFTVNSSCMMKIGAFQGLVSKALMFGLYGENLQNGAPIMTYTLDVPEPCTKRVSFGVSGCNKGSWNDAAALEFRIFKQNPVQGDTLDSQNWGTSNYKPDEGGVVTGYDEYQKMITFPTAGTYIFEWKMPNENSHGGGHKGGRILYYFEVSNEYQTAYQYIEKVEVAYASAERMRDVTAADIKFSGSVLDALKKVMTEYDGFTTVIPPHTDPADYNKAADDLSAATSAMQARVDSVNLYYSEYDKTNTFVQSYEDSIYKGFAVIDAAKDLLDKNAELDMPTTDAAQLRVLIKNFQDAQTAIKDRQTLVEKFVSTANNVVTALEEKKDYDYFAEYPALQTAYNNNKDQDVVLGTDAEVTAATDAMQNALNALNGKIDGALAMTHQARLLMVLAEQLGVDFDAMSAGSGEQINEILKTFDRDDADLIAALKLAVKARIYELIAAGETLPADLDLSGFITNPGLYSTAVVDQEMERFTYTYGGTSDRWRLNRVEYTTVFPGWKMKANAGNVHVGDEARNWTNASPVFDAWIAADWNSGFTISQTVEELPLGTYTIGVGYNNNQTNVGCNFVVHAEGNDILPTDTVIVKNGSEGYPEVPNVFVNDVSVAQGSVTMTINHANVGGWARVENFALTYKASLSGVDYADLVADLQAAAAEAISDFVTGVSNVTVSSSVEYYNLNGIRLAAPQKGINIKVTTGADGKRVSEKILVK